MRLRATNPLPFVRPHWVFLLGFLALVATSLWLTSRADDDGGNLLAGAGRHEPGREPLGEAPGRGVPPVPRPVSRRAMANSGDGLRTPSRTSAERDGAVLIHVPAGVYTFGDRAGRYDELPEVEVRLSSFFIDRDEVSNERYARFVDDSGYRPRGPWRRGFVPGQGSLPVRFVTWHDARAYARWAGRRLPTEAEWEAAARRSLESGARPVTGLAPGEGPLSLDSGPFARDQGRHMMGNVREWTADWYDRYRNRALFLGEGIATNPRGPRDGATAEERFIEADAVAGNERATRRVVRGASWAARGVDAARPSARGAHNPDNFFDDVGFRCARDADEGGR